MKPTRRHNLRSILLLTLCLLSVGSSLAQSLLTDYQDATAALRSSVAAFPADQVESLDALRRAETAFTPLSVVLEASLRRGLEETFSRAEEAIVNQSETDLQVQAAVLQGGFGRAVYQQALTDAGSGELENAQNLLNVLARDLGLANTQFSGTSQRALQGAFEARLAGRGLEQLDAFGSDLGSRYRALAQVYSYVFLVQDSPRLPPETRDTVVGTIRALVSAQPTEQGVKLLRAQLTGFARNAERAAATAAATPAQAAGAQTIESQGTGAQGQAGPGSSPATTTPGETTPTAGQTSAQPAGSTGATDPTGAATEPFVPTVTTEDPPAVVLGGAPSDPTAALPGSSAQTSSAQTNTAQTTPAPTPAQPAGVAALPFLTPELYAILLMAAGLLALIGLIRLLVTPSWSPWRDAALALLLLPAIAEGLIALAGFLAPLLGQPLLAQAATYSLFVNPVVQFSWLVLTGVAVLCLAVPRRGAPAPQAGVYAADTPETYAADETRDETRVERHTPQAARSSPLTTGNLGNLNWDEDF